jgi:hypothetical protein
MLLDFIKHMVNRNVVVRWFELQNRSKVSDNIISQWSEKWPEVGFLLLVIQLG